LVLNAKAVAVGISTRSTLKIEEDKSLMSSETFWSFIMVYSIFRKKYHPAY